MSVLTGSDAVNDSLTGTGAADTISGLGGDDTLIGSGGNDSLLGGNGLDLLNGGAGADTMVGGDGNDTYIVNDAGDLVSELSNKGTDLVQASISYTMAGNVEQLLLTGAGTINGTGNSQNNLITGNNANNVLDGKTGADTMAGVAGNDTYMVNDVGDVVTEDPGKGTDLVQSSVSYTLGKDVEQLLLIGSANIDGTGSNQANLLTGNKGDNVLDGKTGADTMAGDLGNDIYVVNEAGDVVSEDAGKGNDLVKSSVSYTLGANLEKLTLIGAGNIDGTGNERNNTVTGNAHDNVLDGGLGADRLVGGGGNDTLVYDSADVKVDGGIGTDTLFLNASGMTLNLSGLANDELKNLEQIQLSGASTLHLTAQQVVDLSDSDALLVRGGGSDAVVAAGLWGSSGVVNLGGTDYTEFHQAGATLQVQVGVDVSGIESALDHIDLAALDGSDGFRLLGAATYDYAGTSVSGAGDVNGDGFGDLIVGAPFADAPGDNSGAAYVVFGAASGFGANVQLSSLDGSNGFRLGGQDSLDGTGRSVSAAGDVNGDGLADVIVSAPYADPNSVGNAGTSYVVFGSTSGFDAQLQPSALDGTNGFRISDAANHGFGYSVSGAGDINGDGFADLIGGAWALDVNGGRSGGAFVVFGSGSGFAADLALTSLDGSNGFRMTGKSAYNYAGFSVSGAGDVNGDGIGDLIVGARGEYSTHLQAGASYVLFGQATGFASSLELSALDGSDGFAITGTTAFDNAGFAVSAAGDVNGDGYGDLVVGVPYANPGGRDNAGEAYVVFGQASGFASRINASSLDGSNGFRIDGELPSDQTGRSVSSAGDVNGDGYDDLIVGATALVADPDSGNDLSGASYVVFGRASGFGADLQVSALDGTNGFRILGESAGDQLGRSVSAAGDVNGDGFYDLIVGASNAHPYGNPIGASYVIYGRDFNFAAGFMGTPGDDTITTSGEGVAVSAGAGDDRIEIGDGLLLRADGGAGEDTLAPGAVGETIAFTDLPPDTLRNIEAFDLGDHGNTLSVTALDVLNLSDTSNTLRVLGGASDAVHASGIWTFGGMITDGGQAYDVYTKGAARLEVDHDMGRSIALIPSSIDLASLDGSNGFKISGTVIGDRAGWSVASAGDVNGDGFGDLIIGAPYANAPGNDSGASYVVFGKACGFSSNLDLASLTGANGFKISGAAGSNRSGWAVSSAGDLNGDGFDDVIVGALYANGSTGAAYVIFGKESTAFGANLALSSLSAGDGFRLSGESVADRAGFSVAAAGDFNGDGYADVIVGAPGATANGNNQSGAAYVVFGNFTGFGTGVALSALDGSNGFQISGGHIEDQFGISVSSAGDLNHDGYADVLVGAVAASPNGLFSGASYVVYGAATGFGANLDLSALDGTNGFRISGVAAYDNSGRHVASAGDVNGDGLADLLVGAYGAGDHAGATYVVFGRASGFGTNLDLSSLDGANGFRIAGEAAGDNSGFSASAAGDVNGDGFGDVLIGARGYNSPGASYLVFGAASGFASNLDLSSLDGINGFKLAGSGIEQAGFSVSAAGDVNGDGFDDLLIGANFADAPADHSGASYVLFGGNFTGAVQYIGGVGPDYLAGTAADEGFTGAQGDDTLVGGLGHDVLAGGTGEDVFLFNTLPDSVLNFDLIRDFHTGEDHIQLDMSVFTVFGAPGTVIVESVQVALESQISDITGDDGTDGYADYLKYATNTGNLYYDSNGIAAGGLELIARVTTDGITPAVLHFNPALDIEIVSIPV